MSRHSIVSLTLILVLAAGCSRKEQSIDVNAQIDSGWTYYQRGEYDRAISHFDAAAKGSQDGSDAHLQSLYGAATAWHLRRPKADAAKAEQLYRAVIDLSPQHDLAAWSLLALARIRHLTAPGTDPDFAAVDAAYQACIARFPKHLAGEEAFIYQQSMRIASLQHQDATHACRALETFAQTHSGSPFVSSAYALMAECYTLLRQPGKAVRAKIKSMETQPLDENNPLADNAWNYWSIATSAEFEAADFATARTYYRRLFEEYPTDIRNFAARQALERMDKLEAQALAEVPR